MTAKKQANTFADLDDNGQYGVTLVRPIKRAGRIIRPSPDLVLKGKLIKEHADDIGEVRDIAHPAS